MKTLGIKTIDGIDNPVALDDAIVPATINTSSLGSLALSILDTATDLVCLVVDPIGRKVYGFPAAEGVATAIVATIAAIDSVTKVFTKDDATKRSSTWSMTGGTAFSIGAGSSNPIQNVVKPEQPSLTSGQLVGAIEDALAVGEGLEGVFLVLSLDQGTGNFNVHQFASEDDYDTAIESIEAAEPTIGYEQIPAVTSSSTREPLG